MKDNNSQKTSIIKIFFFILLTYALISSWIRFFSDINTINEGQKNEKEMQELVEQKNRQIDLITEVDENFFSSKIDTLKFEYDIEIPMPNDLIEEENIVSCKKCIESNEIAHESYVVKVVYGENSNITNMILDIFKERLPEDHNYEQVYYYDDYGTRIYTREENEGYFSYIIFRGAEVTYGVCYGEPKIKNI